MISDENVIAAVEFLDDVPRKHWNDADLRRYLVGKQGLSTDQVTQAFRIHRSRSSSFRNQPDGKNLLEAEMSPKVMSPKLEMSPSLVQSTSPSFIQLGSPETGISIRAAGSGERSERTLIKHEEEVSRPNPRKSTSEIASSTSFLLPSKREDGEKLIRDFLACEEVYCIVLNCLEEYHKELSWHARQGSIDLKLEEVEKIFQQIPELHSFHKSFYEDVTVGGNLGRLFIRRMKSFKAYGRYLKDATFAIEQLRDHISDMKLSLLLVEIRKRSRLKQNDLADLVITPINRMMDYEVFITKLYDWADKANVVEYQYFAKAARRIGRVAKYIDSYRHGIINRSEMNRVQEYLGNQVKILHPNRSIIRKGMITRRMSGWVARKKKYQFFLFSDVLIWTTKNGVLQNVVELLDCQVLPWQAKSDSQKKFKIVVDMRSSTWTKQDSKTILLECNTKEARCKWYRAIESTIKSAKKKTSETSPEEIICASVMNDSDEELNESVKPYLMQSVPKVSNVSQTFSDIHKKRTIKKKESITPEERRTPTETSSIDVATDGPYHDRYESHNFMEQDFKEIFPMDETDSQISEYDNSFFEKFGRCQHKRNSVGVLSPHLRFSPRVINCEEKKNPAESKEEDRNKFIIHHSRTNSCAIERRRSSIFRETVMGVYGNQHRDNYVSDFVISLEDLDMRTDK